MGSKFLMLVCQHQWQGFCKQCKWSIQMPHERKTIFPTMPSCLDPLDFPVLHRAHSSLVFFHDEFVSLMFVDAFDVHVRNVVVHVEWEEKLLFLLARYLWRRHNDVGVASLEFHTQRVVASLIYLCWCYQGTFVIGFKTLLGLVLNLENWDLTSFESSFERVLFILIITVLKATVELAKG